MNDYPKFKKKIIHLVIDKEPDNLISKRDQSIAEKRLNSVIRIKYQRNYIMEVLNQFSSEDFIIHSDNDEIPNLDNFDLLNSKNKFVIFKQKIFYYKLNLLLPSLDWYGSKACKLKNIKDIDNLRAIKNKKYPFYRFDTLFSKLKHQSLEIVNEGGWHFSNLKNIDDLEKKYLNDENHSEYEAQGFTIERIKNNIKNRVIDYNHEAKKDSNERFKQTKLDVAKTDILPKYIRDNLDRYREWII